MRTFFLAIIGLIATQSYLIAQSNVGIGTNTPHSSSVLEVSAQQQGVLLPRMDSMNRLSIPNPANGLIIYDTDYNCLFSYESGKGWKNYCEVNTGLPGWVGIIDTFNFRFLPELPGGYEFAEPFSVVLNYGDSFVVPQDKNAKFQLRYKYLLNLPPGGNLPCTPSNIVINNKSLGGYGRQGSRLHSSEYMYDYFLPPGSIIKSGSPNFRLHAAGLLFPDFYSFVFVDIDNAYTVPAGKKLFVYYYIINQDTCVCDIYNDAIFYLNGVLTDPFVCHNLNEGWSIRGTTNKNCKIMMCGVLY